MLCPGLWPPGWKWWGWGWGAAAMGEQLEHDLLGGQGGLPASSLSAGLWACLPSLRVAVAVRRDTSCPVLPSPVVALLSCGGGWTLSLPLWTCLRKGIPTGRALTEGALGSRFRKPGVGCGLDNSPSRRLLGSRTHASLSSHLCIQCLRVPPGLYHLSVSVHLSSVYVPSSCPSPHHACIHLSVMSGIQPSCIYLQAVHPSMHLRLYPSIYLPTTYPPTHDLCIHP